MTGFSLEVFTWLILPVDAKLIAAVVLTLLVVVDTIAVPGLETMLISRHRFH